jgi:hypothetical protein
MNWIQTNSVQTAGAWTIPVVTCPVATRTFCESCAAQDTDQYWSPVNRVTTLRSNNGGNSFASGAGEGICYMELIWLLRILFNNRLTWLCTFSHVRMHHDWLCVRECKRSIAHSRLQHQLEASGPLHVSILLLRYLCVWRKLIWSHSRSGSSSGIIHYP